MTTWEPLPLRAEAPKATVHSACMICLRMLVEFNGDLCSACHTHGRVGLLTVSQCRLDGTVGAVVA